MTQQPPNTFPPRMPTPTDAVRADLTELVQVLREQNALLQNIFETETRYLHRLVELAEQNKAALDAMTEPPPNEFSVRGLAKGDEEDSPFIGGA